MTTHNLIKDTEVAVRQCLQIINIATKAVISSWEKVILLDGTILYYNKSISTATPPVVTAPTVGAGEALIECGNSDFEPKVLCEFNSDGVYVKSFLRSYTLASDGTYTVKDTELDGITTYLLPAGNVINQCVEGKLILTPTASTSGTAGSPVIVPPVAKSVSIVNLGVNGLGITFEPITLSGGAAYVIPAQVQVHNIGVEEDQDSLPNASITVTPGASSFVFVSWMV